MLEVKGLAVSYGRHRALEGVGVKVDKGEICVILGANGAGKSTLLKTIAGMVRADSGEVVMNGRAVTRLKPHKIVEEGIALVPEGRGIFGDLSVAENLQLGAFAQRARRDERATLEAIYALFPRLAERKRQVARTMSGGEQHMVAIGRALMSRPEILMLDEPSLGLSPILTQELFRALTAVAATGVGILLVEQNAKQSLKIAKRGYLIENGHVTGENSAEALRNDPAVIAASLGGAAGGRAVRPSVHLPPSIHLPTALAAMGRMAGDLASRAGSISHAFVRALRREGSVPSAFVGRYDPKAGGDPWAEAKTVQPADRAIVPSAPTPPPQEARWLAASSANFAQRASDRLAQHIASSRRAAPVPSAFVSRPPERPAEAPLLEAMRQDDHVETRKLNGSHGLIGHNSAAAALDDAAPAPLPRAEPAILSIADMAARATAIHKRHVEAQRRNTPGLAAPGETHLPLKPAASDGNPDAAPTPAVPRQDKISIADLVTRAAAIQRRHVDESRKALSALTIPAASMADGSAPISQPAPPPAPAGKEGLRKAARKAEEKARRKAEAKAAERKSARKGKKPRKKHEEAR